MLCEQCQDKDACVHLTQVIDGHVKKLHLCDACAAESGFEVEGATSVTDILLGMGGVSNPISTKPPTSVERSCPKCHMRKSDFKKTGQFGCPVCYETFLDELHPLLKAMHRGERHIGKIPEKEGLRVRVSAQLARLLKDLDEAVNEENFEEAARLRDQIRECECKVEKADEESVP